MFQVPDTSSSPPSTPDSRHGKSRSFFSHASTTPAAPPPRSLTNPSTTPAGPPPSSLLGSNRYGSSLTSRTPPKSRPNVDFRGSPLKFVSSRRANASHDAPDEDADMDFDVSVHGGLMRHTRDEKLAQSIEGTNISAVAKSISSHTAPLHETGDLILGTDQIIERLYSVEETEDVRDDTLGRALSNAVQMLLKLWTGAAEPDIATIGIGPGDQASDIAKAVFLCSLVLPFQHPSNRATNSSQFKHARYDFAKPIPEVLLDWLRDHHNQYPNDYSDLMRTPKNPAANERFWSILFSLNLRGRLRDVCNLLREADFSHAWTALEDGATRPGYDGKQLGNVQRVVNRAISVLESCPALHTGDWDVKGADWSIYRKRIVQALSDLETFAEGSTLDGSGEAEPFEAEHFGLSSSRREGFSMSRLSQRAQSKVPWAVYESLKQLYAQSLGDHAEILAASADWVEATIGLAVWWDGNDNALRAKNHSSSRRIPDKQPHTRNVDVRPTAAYQEKLMVSLRQITAESDEAELQVNTSNPVEVGLACIFEGDMDGLVTILRTMSRTISTTVTELASFGKWLNEVPSPSKALMQNFDESDLMVLSVAKHSTRGVDPDSELVGYAKLLDQQSKIRSSRGTFKEVDGWELAVQILSRVQDEAVADAEIARILDRLELDERRIAKLTALCNELNMPQLGRKMSEKYADQLTQSSTCFGEALYYYARAHQRTKVRSVLNMLITNSLVQSCAYPTPQKTDNVLSSMINNPGPMLADVRLLDHQAADILSSQLAGYATLRHFYELRDFNATAARVQRPSPRPLARKHEAAKAMVSLIMSAADSIHGGLYDDTVNSVVPMNCLLLLLGESLVFVNQTSRILSTSHIFALLKAVEDISIVSPEVLAQCEETFRSALDSSSDSSTGLARLQTSASNLSGSSEFSVMSRSIKASQSNGSLEESGVIVERVGGGGPTEVRRAWDWRSGFDKSAKIQDVLQILRLGLAREVSRAWVDS